MPEVPDEPEDTKKRVLRLVDEIAELPGRYPEPVNYFREFLTRVLTAVAAPAGAAYLLTPGNKLQMLYAVNAAQTGLADNEARQAHDGLLRYAVEVARPLTLKPHEHLPASENGRISMLNPTGYYVFLAPIEVDGKIAGLVEVFQDHDRAPNAQYGFSQFITKMTEFASAYVQGTQEQKNESLKTFPRQRIVRGLVALLAGLLVSGLAWDAARVHMYQLHYGWGIVDWTQGYTQYRLERIDQALSLYQEKFKAPPKSLKDLQTIDDSIKTSQEESLRDGWQRPFLYTTDGVTCLVTSYGRDGKPGGLGLDCDLTNQNIRPDEARPTFAQFLSLAPLPPNGVVLVSLLSGVVTSVLSYISIRAGKLTVKNACLAACRIALVVVAATLMSGVMTLFHLSGH